MSVFSPITLDEMGKAGLLTRIDTKFVTSRSLIAPLLERAMRDYHVLEIAGKRKMSYYTCYLDTEQTEMFYEHQRGKKVRQKVRIRSYEDGEQSSFLEVKDKNNHGRTHKSRMLLSPDVEEEDCRDFIMTNSRYELDLLLKQIENHFKRITLVRNDLSERITIDTSLRFHNLRTNVDADMEKVAVIEWKHSALSQSSPMKRILRDLRIRESGFSKYCIGMARTASPVKTNRIMPRLRMIGKLSAERP